MRERDTECVRDREGEFVRERRESACVKSRERFEELAQELKTRWWKSGPQDQVY